MRRAWVVLFGCLCFVVEVCGQEALTVLNSDVIGPLPATAQFGRVETPVPSLRVTRTVLGCPDELYRRLDSRHERNLLGGYEHFYYRLSFTGKPLEIKHVHSTSDTIISDIVRYTYDNMERQLTISLDHNGKGEAPLSGNAYDLLGRLAACAANDGGCTVAYAYNVRGWTRNVNAIVGTATIFGQTLHYEDAPSGGTPCWGGNISGISWWQRESMKAATPTESRYRFTYDALNRLTKADYSSDGEQWNGDLLTQGDRNFSCAYAYDLNGNMLSLKCYGVNFYSSVMPTHIRSFGLIDDLTLSYNGNQLRSVTDQADELTYAGAMDFKDEADSKEEYAYDANGNMTSDLNKGITRITYNPLNLPESILFADGHEILYTYAADGRKLRAEYLLNNIAIIDADKAEDGETSTFALDDVITAPGIGELPAEPAVTTLSVRDYCGEHIHLNGKLECTLTPNGYIQDGEPYFYVKDYQGNVRAVLNQQNQVVELTCYYPYGGIMAATATESVQPYKYGTKELDRQNGLNWYDSQARFYDSLLGRTPTQDPMAEKYPHLSPYLWCAANPVNTIDPTGKELIPKGRLELQMIRNTLPADASGFVVIDDNGSIDKNKLAQYAGNSYNFNVLKFIVNSSIKMVVELNDNYTYIDELGNSHNKVMSHYDFDPTFDSEEDKDVEGNTINGLSTGESGLMGVTLFPDRDGKQGATDDSIHVVVNSKLSEKGAAEIYSHEANGHGALYLLNGGSHSGAIHHFSGSKDLNHKLVEMILLSKKETVINMRNR